MNVKIIRSNRKTLAIQINPDLSVTVRAPIYASQREIGRILKEKEGWIQKHIEKIREQEAKRKEMYGEKGEYGKSAEREYLSNEEIHKLAEKALEYIPKRVSYFAKQIGVTYGKITIRNQKTRWGSCSSKGNLNFNCLLMLTPPEVIDYVVVHELCHRKEMNHSGAFWAEIEKVIPSYKEQVKWLKENGGKIIGRMKQ
ncbi:MAG: M48 family metallopeptidase [Lachnospiraceae bacterium]